MNNENDIKFEEINFNGATGTVTPAAPAQPTQSVDPFDLTDVETFGDFEDLTPGAYKGAIEEVEIHPTKGGTDAIKVVFKLAEGGQKDWTYINLFHSNPNVVGMSKRDLKSLLEGFGITAGKFNSLAEIVMVLKQIVGWPATLKISWAMKNDFKTRDQFGQEVIKPDYNPDLSDHHYVNKSFKKD